jgi:tRNA modification GTPase
MSWRRRHFRFIDSWNPRDSGGKHWYQKTFEKIEQAQLVIYLMDSLKFQVSGSESIIEIEKLKTNIP